MKYYPIDSREGLEYEIALIEHDIAQRQARIDFEQAGIKQSLKHLAHLKETLKQLQEVYR